MCVWTVWKVRTVFGHGRPHVGANGVSWPPGNGWKIKKRKHAKQQFSEFLNRFYWAHLQPWEAELLIWAHSYVYVIFWEQSGQADEENGAMLTTYLFSILQNAPFRSQLFQNFLRLRRQGALTTLTKILRTLLCFTVNVKLTACRSLVRDVVRFVIVVSALNNG